MKLPPLYRLWDQGEKVECHRDLYTVGIYAFAKTLEDHSPYEFANEWICGQLATAIRLPVAHGVFVDREGTNCYASFNSFMGEELPPCTEDRATALIAAHPSIACGIVLFDLWILNKDRHPNNVGYDKDTKSIHVFDHGDALMRGTNPSTYLNENRHKCGMDIHCLAKYITGTAMAHKDEWISRIKGVPDKFIGSVISETIRFGVDQHLGEFTTKFLLERREELDSLIEGNKNMFPKAFLPLLRKEGA